MFYGLSQQHSNINKKGKKTIMNFLSAIENIISQNNTRFKDYIEHHYSKNNHEHSDIKNRIDILENGVLVGEQLEYGFFLHSNFEVTKQHGTINMSDAGNVILKKGKTYSIHIYNNGRVNNNSYVVMNIVNNFGDIIHTYNCLSIANQGNYLASNSSICTYTPEKDCEIFLRCVSGQTFIFNDGTMLIQEIASKYDGVKYDVLFSGRLSALGATATLTSSVMNYKYVLVTDSQAGYSYTFVPSENGNILTFNATINAADRRMEAMILENIVKIIGFSNNTYTPGIDKVYGFY